MAVNLNHPSLPITFFNPLSYSSRFHHHPQGHGTSLSKLTKLIPLSAISPSNQNPSSTPLSSSSIFLSFLQEQEEINSDSETLEVETKKDELITDPIHKFFKSRSSSQHPDPGFEGKFTLQKNRRSSWHLSPTITNTEPEESEPETPVISIAESEKENEESGGSVNKVSSTSNSVNGVLEIARNLPENVTLGEVLGPYEGKLSERECVQVLGLMGQKGLIMGCLYFFEWMSLQEPSLVTPWAYSALFPVLGRAGMGDKLMILFNNLPDAMEFKQVHVYNSAISALSDCGRYDDAWRLFEIMEKHNVEPDHVTCSIMITVMRRKGNSAKDAWGFFEILNMRGLEWSLEVMGALIKSFCDEGLKKEALIIQLEMEKKGIASNAIVYNTIMDAYGKLNQIEEAEGLFAEMKAKGIAPTTVSYNILMDAYSRRMQPEVIEKLMLEMEETGLQPDVKSFTCLISAYGRQKKMSDMAANAFLKMKRFGIKPTSHSYTALIHAYSISGWHEKADITFQNMLREGVKPSIETYTALLDAFRRAGDTESLMRIWKMMINDKVEGTRVTFNILVDGFAKQGQYSEARDVICEFGKIGLQPTVMTYNMLINAYARGGQESKLPQLLKEMAALQLKPDSITYSTMIYAYVRVRDFKRAFFYHKQMVKSGQVPDAKSYHKLRAILDVKAATKNKKDKSAIMGIISNKLGWVKVKKKGKKDEFWKNKTKRSRAGGSDSMGRR